MHVSTKSRYALRAVVYLASQYPNERVSIKEISEKESISKRYLELIFAELKKSDFIQSVKGTKGGYFLSKKPSEISVGDVLRLFEGNLDLIEEEEKQTVEIESIEYILMEKVWKKMSEEIITIADSISIQDIILSYQGLGQNMFYI